MIDPSAPPVGRVIFRGIPRIFEKDRRSRVGPGDAKFFENSVSDLQKSLIIRTRPCFSPNPEVVEGTEIVEPDQKFIAHACRYAIEIRHKQELQIMRSHSEARCLFILLRESLAEIYLIGIEIDASQ